MRMTKVLVRSSLKQQDLLEIHYEFYQTGTHLVLITYDKDCNTELLWYLRRCGTIDEFHEVDTPEQAYALRAQLEWAYE